MVFDLAHLVVAHASYQLEVELLMAFCQRGLELKLAVKQVLLLYLVAVEFLVL
jgi:hypothetical protein